VEGILEHTMFKGTYFPTWEGLFWEKVRTAGGLPFNSWPRAVWGGRSAGTVPPCLLAHIHTQLICS